MAASQQVNSRDDGGNLTIQAKQFVLQKCIFFQDTMLQWEVL